MTRRDQHGFTLIELLVVIIVLGILAAVVVFAVSGVGDKGKSASVAIDARTIQTAEETYCSQNGKYGTTEELVAADLLSGTPSYNQVFLDTTWGPCDNTSYQIFERPDPADLPDLSGACAGPIDTWCSGPPNNTVLNFVSPLLPNGTILLAQSVIGLDGGSGVNGGMARFLAYDPNSPVTFSGDSTSAVSSAVGGWSAEEEPLTPDVADTPPGVVPHYVGGNGGGFQVNNATSMHVIKGPTAWCGTNCGKVLTHFRTNRQDYNNGPHSGAPWVLYDPNTPAAPGALGSWQDLSTDAPIASTPGVPGGGGPYQRFYYANAIQLTRTPCGNLCGKFLIVGQGSENGNRTEATPPDPEIWDPATGEFSKLGLDTGYQEGTAEFSSFGASPTLNLLGDGTVFMGSKGNDFPSLQIFDPVTEKFTTIPAPEENMGRGTQDSVISLSDGGVMMPAGSTGEFNVLYIYRPGLGFEAIPSCSLASDPGAQVDHKTPNNDHGCQPQLRLPNGKVIAERIKTTGLTATRNRSHWLFDPSTVTNPSRAWVLMASPATNASTNRNLVAFFAPRVIEETRPGSCGNICGRVFITATSGTSRFYRPVP